MPITGGKQVYSADHAPVTATGYFLSASELDVLLRERVAPAMRDDEGTKEIKEMLAAVADTDFMADALNEILDSRDSTKSWQVGEAIAEAHLSLNNLCLFPWPTSRDLRDLKASLPGTDLVGFQKVKNADRPYRFAFGEVKTSNQADTPPSVMYGRHGLKEQLEDLRNKSETRHTLFLYLAHRAKTSHWVEHFRHAAAHYLADFTDVALFGVLVRDIHPSANDLSARANSLAIGCPPAMGISLIAVYLPLNAIAGLPAQIDKLNEGGSYANN